MSIYVTFINSSSFSRTSSRTPASANKPSNKQDLSMENNMTLIN